MSVIDLKTPDEILRDEINHNMSLIGRERQLVLNAMNRYKKQREPKSFVTKLKELFRNDSPRGFKPSKQLSDPPF